MAKRDPIKTARNRKIKEMTEALSAMLPSERSEAIQPLRPFSLDCRGGRATSQ